jgi:hydrogenase-4 component E
MTSQALDLLAAVLLLAALRTVAAHRLADHVGGFVLQSAVLALLAATIGFTSGSPDLLVVAALTVGGKVVIVPRILRRVAAELPAERGVPSAIGVPASVVVAIALSVLSFLAAGHVATVGSGPGHGELGVSVSVVLIGLFLISTRRHAVAQLVGLLTLENGMFAGTLAMAPGMPWVIEFGILLDVLIAVAVMGLLVTLIHREVATADTAALRRLRG